MVENPTQLIDIFPTIQNLIGAEPDATQNLRGNDLLNTAKEENLTRPEYTYAEYLTPPPQLKNLSKHDPSYDFNKLNLQIKTVRSTDYKLIISQNNEYLTEELYNLKEDPNETRNCIKLNKEQSRELRELLSQIQSNSNRAILRSREIDHSEEVEEHLKDLGYL